MVDGRAERRVCRPFDRVTLLVDHDSIALHKCLRVCHTVNSSDLIDDTNRQSVTALEAEKAFDRVRRLHIAIDSLEDVGEQRVERALHGVPEDEGAAEERGTGHDRQRRQHDSSPTSPHAAQRQADHRSSAGRHVVAMASMMSTLVARRAGMTAAITPTMNETTRMTIVLNTGTENTVTPSSRNDSTNR